MLHRTVLPPSDSLDQALAQVVSLLPKRAKLERYKPNRDEMYILRREHLPDLSNFIPALDEIYIVDYEGLPASPACLTQPLFPETGSSHGVQFDFTPGTHHGSRLGWWKTNGITELSIHLAQNVTEPVKALKEMLRCLGLEKLIRVDTSRPEGYQIVSSTLSLRLSAGMQLAGDIWINPGSITINDLPDIAQRLRQAPFADDPGTITRSIQCSAAEYQTLLARSEGTRGPWNVSFLGCRRTGALSPTPMPIATCYLPKEQVVEVEYDEATRQTTLYSVFPLNPPTPDTGPVLAGGCSPLDPFIVDWAFLQQTWQQKPDIAALIHTIRSDDRCEALDDNRWEPEPKAQVAASDIVELLIPHIDPTLATRLTRLSQSVWAGGVHDLCPEQLPEPCLAMSLSPERVAQLAFTLTAADKAAIKTAFAQIDVDEEWWLGNAKDFLAYLTTWLKLMSRAKKNSRGVVVIFYG